MGFELTASTLRMSGSRRFDQGLSEDFPGSDASIPSSHLTIPPLPFRQGHVRSRPTRRNSGVSHFKPVTWAFGGGDGIRTHGLYIANVWFSGFRPGLLRGHSWWRHCDPLRFPHDPSPSLMVKTRKDTLDSRLAGRFTASVRSQAEIGSRRRRLRTPAREKDVRRWRLPRHGRPGRCLRRIGLGREPVRGTARVTTPAGDRRAGSAQRR